MTKYLPPSLLALFAPRPPLPFKPPIRRAHHRPPSGLAAWVGEFEDPKTVDYGRMTKPEQIADRRARRRREKEALRQTQREREIALWQPGAGAAGDPRKTLFLARLSYEASERDVEKEFDAYGKIRKVTLVRDRQGQPRGYGFVEYEEERSMRKAYNDGDGTRVKGRRVLVDVERGRTTPGFKPRRLGGGLGRTRADKKSKKQLALEAANSTVAPSSSSSSTSTRDAGRKRSRSRERDRDRDRDRDRRRR